MAAEKRSLAGAQVEERTAAMGREQQSRQLEAEVTTLRGELAALRGEKRRTVRASRWPTVLVCWHSTERPPEYGSSPYLPTPPIHFTQDSGGSLRGVPKAPKRMKPTSWVDVSGLEGVA